MLLVFRAAIGFLILTSMQKRIYAQNNAARVSSKATLDSLFRRLQSDDPAIRASARTTLNALGFSQQEIDRNRTLIDPDPKQRIEYVNSLDPDRLNQRSDFLLMLSRDVDHRVRSAVLDALRKSGPLPQFVSRVREMAKSDGDPTVRGFARLLAAEWADEAAPPQMTESAEKAHLTPEREHDFDSVPPPPLGFDAVVPFWIKASSQADEATEAGLMMPLNRDQPTTINLPDHQMHAATTVLSNPFEAGDRRLGDASESDPETRHAFALDDFNFPPETDVTDAVPPIAGEYGSYLETQKYATLGYAGPSGLLPSEFQESDHFAPVEDRWRIGFPEWDRYGFEHPFGDDYPFSEGHWWDPYNQNVLKGDYPILGQHTFLNITGTSLTIYEWREVPTGTTPFESTFNPFSEEFLGNPRQAAAKQFFKLRLELFHGNAAFKPADWKVRVEPVFNLNYLKAKELAVVNPDVRKGKRRSRDDFALQEWFIEKKLADLSAEYDFLSVRAGSQFFVSDFRGFIFSDTNRAVRLFGTRRANRDQFNLIWFDQTEKETNSELNTFDDRHQNTLIANYYRQDFIVPGYTAQFSIIYNADQASFKFDENDFLVRPDPAGVARPHKVQSMYFGINGDGHLGRLNVSNAFYWVTGRDSMNPIAGKKQTINAHMGALELSYDRDYVRFRASWFFTSGDDDVFDGKARGFDSVFDNPNFAGGPFSYWQRNAIRLFGVNLVQRESLIPNLRSSKIQGQSNFVNPGLSLINVGMDIDITPKLKLVTNANYLWFNSTHILEIFTFQDKIDPEIGTDLSIGVEYRPFLNDNVMFIAGFSTFIPGKGFDDLFGIANPLELFEPKKIEAEQMFSNFVELVMTY
ncbi:MAG: hypothetical protein IH899_13615 [Planctomycetes bacterium]|nr:hypothetical protein [Planctomycetota bacterium]